MRSESSEVKTRWQLGRDRRARQQQNRKLSRRQATLESLEVRSLLSTLPVPAVALRTDLSGTGQSDESIPTIVINQANPQQVVAVWTRNVTGNDNSWPDPGGADYPQIGVEGAYSVDGGQRWSPLSFTTLGGPLFDPNTPPDNRDFYTRVTDPSVGFDRQGNFYVLMMHSNAAGTSGALALSKFSFTSGTPSAQFRNQILYQWSPATDRVVTPTMVVDDTVGASLQAVNRLDQPTNATVGPDGNVYVLNQGSGDVVRYALSGAFIDVFVPAGTGGLSNPRDLAFGPDGALYVTDGNRVLRYSGNTGSFLNVFVAPNAAGLTAASALDFGPDGNLYVADLVTSSVLRFNGTTGAPVGSGVFVAAGSGSLSQPTALAFQGGNLYVTSSGGNAVLRYNGTTGAFIDAFVPTGSGGLSQPSSLLFRGADLFVSSLGTDQVLRYNAATGAFIGAFVPAGSAGLNDPVGLAIGLAGNLLVASRATDQILSYNGTTGAFIDSFADDEIQTIGGYTDPATGAQQINLYSGNVYVAWGAVNTIPGNNPNNFNPNRVVLISSSDGGLSFTGQTFVDDGGNFGSQRHGRPRLTISQGTADGRVQPGQVTVVWDDFGSGAGAGTPFDIIWSDRTTPGVSAAFNATGTPIPDVSTVNIPINVQVNDLRFGQLTDLDVFLTLTHPAVQELRLELIAPNGTTALLLNNQNNPGGGSNQSTGGNGGNLGILNGVRVGTIFNDEAVRSVIDFTNAPPARNANAPFIGSYRTEGDRTGIGLDQFYGLTSEQLNGTWILRVTDVTANNTGTVNEVELRLSSASLESFDTQVTTTLVRGTGGATFPLNPGTGINPGGIGPAATIASDNTLGSFSPYQGRLYVAYVNRVNSANNPADNTDVFLRYSDDGGQSWSTFATLINDDDARLDGFSEGDHLLVTGRPQFQPSLAVDPVTGTLAATWLDARNDAARARVATYLTSSIDGGASFAPSTFLNEAQTAVDAISGDTIVIGPVPENQSTGNGTRDATFGFGDHQGLALYNGQLLAAWSSNNNGGVGPTGRIDGTRRLDITMALAPLAAGPRIVDSTMGPVGLTDQFGTTIDPINNTRAADGTPRVTQFEVTFDRPIDPSTFTTEDVEVFYRDSTIPNSSGETVPVLNVVPLDPGAFGPAGAQGATRFRVQIAPRSGIGTYSYRINPDINDRMRSLGSQLVPVATNIYDAGVLNPAQVNRPIPSVGTGGSGNTANDTTNSQIVVAGLPAGRQIVTGSVTINLTHQAPGQLNLTLTAPDGTTVPVSAFGTTSLDSLVGRIPSGLWRLTIVDNVQGGTGTLINWSLNLQTGTVQPVPINGNRMDQNANALVGQPAVNGVGVGDVYAAPRPTGSGTGFVVNPTRFFPAPYDPDTLPLIVSGPHVISSRVPGTPVSGDNLALDRPVNALDVTFDRNMAIPTFTGEDVVQLRGRPGELIQPQSFAATDVGQVIPDAPSLGTPAKVLSTLSIVDDGTFRIRDLNVRVDLTHPRLADLSLSLVYHLGQADETRINLVPAGILSGANLSGTVFDDEAILSITAGSAPYAGTFRPIELLSPLDGRELRGDWQLEIIDAAPGGGTGTLVDWSLEATPLPQVAPVYNATVNLPRVIAPGATITSPLNITAAGFTIADLNVALDITHAHPADLSVVLVAPDGTQVPLFANVGNALSRNFRGTTFDDEAGVPIDQAPSPSFTGIYAPQNPAALLSSLDGKALQGTWQLRVTDNGAHTGGQLNSWSVTAMPQNPVGATARTFRITFPTQSTSGTYLLTLGPDIESLNGDKIDANRNAGVDLLYGRVTATPGAPATQVVIYASVDVPRPLPDVSTVISVLNVTDSFLIADLNLTLDITHLNTPDLRVTLIGPDGTRVVLFDGVGAVGPAGTRRNFTNTTLDDQATTPIQNGAAPFFGTFNPQQALSAFTGKNAAGTWALEITDTTPGNGSVTNQLNNWRLTMSKPIPSSGLGESVADREPLSFRIFTMDPSNPLSSATWTPVGPAASTSTSSRNGYTGRVSSIVIDPSDPSGNTVYAAAASGGVWKTHDFLTTDPDGPTWVPLLDFGPTLSMNLGSIAVFARNNDPNQSILFVATGEAAAQYGYGSTSNGGARGSTANGVGFLRSLDGGATWTLLDSTDNNLPFDQRDHRFTSTRGFKVVVDPVPTLDGQTIVYAALGGSQGGLWRSLDTGMTWELLRAGEATDIVLDAFSKSNDRLDTSVIPTGVPAGNINNLYVAFDGDGVYFSPNRGQTLNLMSGQIGTPQIRDGDVGGLPAVGLNNTPSPNGQAGRIVLAKPEPVPVTDAASAVKNLLYQGWLYAAVTTNNQLQGVYLTKDNGQSWTQLQIQTRPRPNESVRTARPTNDYTAPDYDPNFNNGQYNLSLSVDPLNPSVVYLGGTSTGQESGLIRIDATLVSDSHAMVSFDHDRPDGGNTAFGSNGAAAIVAKDLVNRGMPTTFFTPPTSSPPFLTDATRTQYLNLLQDPRTPFAVGSNVYLANVDSFNNDGTGVRWTPFDEMLYASPSSFAPSTNVHQILTVRDPLTGNTRVIVANDNGVFTGVSQPDGQLDSGIGTARAATYSRVGNLQVGQLFQGAVQPSTVAAQIAGALFYGMTQGNGYPVSDPAIIGNPANGTPANGQIDWTGSTNGELLGYDVATDSQANGTVYQYKAPGLGGLFTEFFQVNGVARTRGLIQTPGGTIDPQWPAFSTIYPGLIPMGRFAVNPLTGQQIVMSSAVGRIFSTINQGQQWNVIGNPGDLDGSYAPAVAYGAPDPSAPGGIGNLGNFIYAGTLNGNIFVTRTGGGSIGGGSAWTNISNGLDGSSVVAIATSPDRGSHAAFAVTLNGAYYTPDSLTTPWSNVTGNLFTIQQNPFGDASLANDKVEFLTDVVVDWRYTIPQDFNDPQSPVYPLVYVSGNAGVYRLSDFQFRAPGSTAAPDWQLYPTVADGAAVEGGYLPSVHVTDLDLSLGRLNPTNGRPIIDSSSPNLLAASTFGQGAFAIRLGPQVFGDLIQFAAGSDSGASVTDRVTNVRNPVIEGLSAQSAFGSSIAVNLIDLTNPANPAIVGTGITDEFGRFSVQVNPGYFLPDGSTDGDKVIGVQAVDQAGTQGNVALFRFTLDTQAPLKPGTPQLQPLSDSPLPGQPGFVAGVTDQDRYTRITSPTLDILTPEPASTVLSLFRNGQLIGTASGQPALGFVTINDPGPVAPDGTYNYTASLVDLAGNVSPVSDPLAVTFDTQAPAQPPTPTIVPADDTGTIGDGITSNTRPRFTGTAEPNSLVQLVDLANNVLGETTADAAGNYTVQPNSNLVPGTITLLVRSIDLAGNISAVSSGLALTIQTSPPTKPTLMLVSADDSGLVGDNITNNTRPRFTGTATPGLTVELIRLDTGAVIDTKIVATNGTYIVRPATALVTTQTRVTIGFQTRVRDAAGNETLSDSLDVTIDTQQPGTGPALALRPQDDTGIVGDSITAQRRPTFIGNVGVANARATIDIIDVATGTVLATTVAGPTGAFSVQLAAPLNNGTIILAARIRDDAGNQGPAGAGLTLRIITPGFDFDNDGKADPAVYQSATTRWSILQSSTGTRQVITMGASGDIAVSGDFDGDGKTDPALYRPSNGTWYVATAGGGVLTVQFGGPTDFPVPGDYDGDGATDFAVYRQSTGQWFILPRSGIANQYVKLWGGPGFVPMPADYDNDGKTDVAVVRATASGNEWYIDGSTTPQMVPILWGNSSDIPVPADYDGDGKADIAIYNPATAQWFVRATTTPQPVGHWGGAGDIPSPADYNGDGKADIAIFRPSTGQFYIAYSGGGAAILNPAQSAGGIAAQAPITFRMPAAPGGVVRTSGVATTAAATVRQSSVAAPAASSTAVSTPAAAATTPAQGSSNSTASPLGSLANRFRRGVTRTATPTVSPTVGSSNGIRRSLDQFRLGLRG